VHNSLKVNEYLVKAETYGSNVIIAIMRCSGGISAIRCFISPAAPGVMPSKADAGGGGRASMGLILDPQPRPPPQWEHGKPMLPWNQCSPQSGQCA